jgi:hypothetical protein
LKESKKFEKMLDDHKKLLYPECKQGLKKLGSALEMMQWKAANGATDKGFEELLGIVKNMTSVPTWTLTEAEPERRQKKQIRCVP